MPDFYVYRKGSFDAAMITHLDCFSDDVRRDANYKYPWARIRLADGLYCAITKWAGFQRWTAETLKPRCGTEPGLLAAVGEYPKEPPARSPSLASDRRPERHAAILDYAETAAACVGLTEREIKGIPLERLLKIAAISRARVVPLGEFLESLDDNMPDEPEAGCDAGDPKDFDAWCDRQSAKWGAALGFPTA